MKENKIANLSKYFKSWFPLDTSNKMLHVKKKKIQPAIEKYGEHVVNKMRSAVKQPPRKAEELTDMWEHPSTRPIRSHGELVTGHTMRSLVHWRTS